MATGPGAMKHFNINVCEKHLPHGHWVKPQSRLVFRPFSPEPGLPTPDRPINWAAGICFPCKFLPIHFCYCLCQSVLAGPEGFWGWMPGTLPAAVKKSQNKKIKSTVWTFKPSVRRNAHSELPVPFFYASVHCTKRRDRRWQLIAFPFTLIPQAPGCYSQ